MLKVTKEQFLEAGAHFGHQTKRSNPKMKKYIFTQKGGVHIIDLHKTMNSLDHALNFIQSVVKEGGKVLFVGTKKQAQNIIKEQAIRSNSFYVCQRWLGGTLTNLKTIQKSVKQLWNIERQEKLGILASLTKKEQILLQKKQEKLEKFLSGIRNMRNLPQVVFVTDTLIEHNAVKEANKLHIPVVAICDTNSDPDPIDFPIPCNDDAAKTINLICTLVADAIIEAESQGNINKDKQGINEEKVLPPLVKPKQDLTTVKKDVVEANPPLNPTKKENNDEKKEEIVKGDKIDDSNIRND